MKRATIVAALSMAAVFAAVGGEQLMNLPPPPKGGRFTTPTDLVWPEKPGDADVCLWSGDRFAACINEGGLIDQATNYLNEASRLLNYSDWKKKKIL